MDIALFAIIVIALLTLLVLGLHRYQLSETQFSADKTSPLPPLGSQALNSFRTVPGNRSEGTSTTAEVSGRELEQEQPETESHALPDPLHADQEAIISESHADIPAPAHQLRDAERPRKSPMQQVPRAVSSPDATSPAPEPELEAAGHAVIPPATPDTEPTVPSEASRPQARTDSSDSGAPENWAERVSDLKKAHQLDAALSVCRQAFPLWSAYQQATLIHRARLKTLTSADSRFDAELRALYRLAAQASFLHDRVKGLPHLTLSQLKGANLAPVEALEFPYQRIGFAELRLIKKTDIKLLLEHWGKPAEHNRPREVHAEAWEKLSRQQQSTLF